MSGSVATQLPAKSNKAPHEIAIACAINMFFTTISLIDYTADRWAVPHGADLPLDADAKGRLLWLGQFHAWRGEDPVVGGLMMLLLLPLPLILIDFAIGATQSLCGWRRASRTRHAADVLQACHSKYGHSKYDQSKYSHSEYTRHAAGVPANPNPFALTLTLTLTWPANPNPNPPLAEP